MSLVINLLLIIYTQLFLTLLYIKVTFSGQKLYLMTSHLESCKNQSEERMKQLRVVFQKLKEAPEDATVIFAGDTNLRDSEVNEKSLKFTRRVIPIFWYTKSLSLHY